MHLKTARSKTAHVPNSQLSLSKLSLVFRFDLPGPRLRSRRSRTPRVDCPPPTENSVTQHLSTPATTTTQLPSSVTAAASCICVNARLATRRPSRLPVYTNQAICAFKIPATASPAKRLRQTPPRQKGKPLHSSLSLSFQIMSSSIVAFQLTFLHLNHLRLRERRFGDRSL